MTDRELAWLETVIGAGQMEPADVIPAFQALLRRLKAAEQSIQVLEDRSWHLEARTWES